MNTIAGIAPGQPVELGLVRDGAPHTVDVALGDRPGQAHLTGAASANPSAKLGMQLQPLTKENAARFGITADRGVVVTTVASGGAAARAGLRPGDLILNVAGMPVSTISDFRTAVQDSDLTDGIRLRVQRGTTVRFVMLMARG